MLAFKVAQKPFRQLLGVIWLVIYFAILALGCSTPSPPHPVFVDTLSIRDLYPEALQIAEEWKKDAYLVDAKTSFWPQQSDEFQGASFSFRSRSTDVVGLVVRYDPTNDLFTEEWLSVFKENPRYKVEISDAEWRLDSVAALEIAQGAGGAKFLSEQLDEDLDLYLRLERHQSGQDARVVWFVMYYAGMPPFADLGVVIDAATGEVLEVDDVGQ